MATNFKMPNNKTTIAIVIAIVLLFIIAITGTVVFLKDKGRTEAADLERFAQQDKSIVEEQSSNSVQNQEQQINEQAQDENQGVNSEQSQENEEQINNQQTVDVTGTTVVINQNTGTVRRDNIQESTIERVETVKIPEQQVSEGHYVGWTPMEVTNIIASDQINVTNNNDIKITKKATTKSGENLVTNGEEITYDITVKNNGVKDVEALEVKDRVPENTTYVKNSAGEGTEEVVENENVIGLVWKIDLKAGEEKTISFKVRVNDNATGVIRNVALANGETTNVVENSIVEASKAATIEGKNVGEDAKVGDKITYTITVKNTGNIAGTANVQDTELQNLIDNKILEIDEESQEIANKLIEGTTVDVPANGEGTVSFTAKVININGAIKNIAVVGESRSEVTINTYGLNVEKKLTEIERNKEKIKISENLNEDLLVRKGDILTYTIKVTNLGSKVINKATITDKLPGNLSALTQTTFDNVKIEAGETVSKEVKAQVTSIKGAIVNVAKAEDTENPDNKGENEITTNTIDFTIDKTAVLTKAEKNKDEKYKNIAEVGDIIHYTVSVTNNGSVKLEELRIVDETMNTENTITLDVGETNSEALKFDHEVLDTDIKVEEGKITYIYNTAAAIYEDGQNPYNNLTVRDTESVEARDKYDCIVNYLVKGTDTLLKQRTISDLVLGKEIKASSYVEKIIKTDGADKESYRYDSADKESLNIGIQGNVINLYYVTNIKKIVVTKVWTQEPDGVDTATIRPTIKLELKVKENNEEIVKYSKEISAENRAKEISCEFEVEEYDENGKIIYEVDESGDEKEYYKKTIEKTSEDVYKITNAYKYTKLVPTKKAYKDSGCTKEVDINNVADNFQPGETVYYKLSVTNEGKVAGSATLTDDLPSYLENYAIVQGNASLSSSKVTWNVTNLNVGETEIIIVKGTVKQIVLYKDLSTKNGSESETTARLYVRKDGKIPYEGSNTPYSPQLYTACVGTVYLNAAKAINYGDLSKSDIYDLIKRNNNIVDAVQKGILFDELKTALASQGKPLADDEVVIWYVIKKEDDGWHIDGAIKKISDLQKVTNTLNMVQTGNNEKATATADIKLSTIATKVVRSSNTRMASINLFSVPLLKAENISKQVENNKLKTSIVEKNTETEKEYASDNPIIESKGTDTEEEKNEDKEEIIVEDNPKTETIANDTERNDIEGNEAMEKDKIENETKNEKINENISDNEIE